MPLWSGSVRSCEVTQSFALLDFLWVSCFCGKEEFGHVARCMRVCMCMMGLAGGWWWSIGPWGSVKTSFSSVQLQSLTKAGSTFGDLWCWGLALLPHCWSELFLLGREAISRWQRFCICSPFWLPFLWGLLSSQCCFTAQCPVGSCPVGLLWEWTPRQGRPYLIGWNNFGL